MQQANVLKTFSYFVRQVLRLEGWVSYPTAETRADIPGKLSDTLEETHVRTQASAKHMQISIYSYITEVHGQK